MIRLDVVLAAIAIGSVVMLTVLSSHSSKADASSELLAHLREMQRRGGLQEGMRNSIKPAGGLELGFPVSTGCTGCIGGTSGPCKVPSVNVCSAKVNGQCPSGTVVCNTAATVRGDSVGTRVESRLASLTNVTMQIQERLESIHQMVLKLTLLRETTAAATLVQQTPAAATPNVNSHVDPGVWRTEQMQILKDAQEDPPMLHAEGRAELWFSRKVMVWPGAQMAVPRMCCAVVGQSDDMNVSPWELMDAAGSTWGKRCDTFIAYVSRNSTLPSGRNYNIHRILPDGAGAGAASIPIIVNHLATAYSKACDWFYYAENPKQFVIVENVRKMVKSSEWWAKLDPHKEPYLIGKQFIDQAGEPFISDSSGMIFSNSAMKSLSESAASCSWNSEPGPSLAGCARMSGVRLHEATDEEYPGFLFHSERWDSMLRNTGQHMISKVSVVIPQCTVVMMHLLNDWIMQITTKKYPQSLEVPLHIHNLVFKNSVLSPSLSRSLSTGTLEQDNLMSLNTSLGVLQAWYPLRLRVVKVGASPTMLCTVYGLSNRHEALFTVYESWGKRCNKFLAFTNATENLEPWMRTYPAFTAFAGDFSYQNQVQKTRAIFAHLAKNEGLEYDYIFHGDDDTFLIVENLKRFLSQLELVRPKGKPLYVGRLLYEEDKAGQTVKFNSGGAGYVLSKSALEKMAPALDSDKCGASLRSYKNDVVTAQCLRSVGVLPLSLSHDELGAERFHFTNPFAVAHKRGVGYISTESVSFHYCRGTCQTSMSKLVYNYLDGKPQQIVL